MISVYLPSICRVYTLFVSFFFFNDTATTEIYTLSLHDALPISDGTTLSGQTTVEFITVPAARAAPRSEEHTSELQSLTNLVCRLLLEKKKIESETDVEGSDADAVGECGVASVADI